MESLGSRVAYLRKRAGHTQESLGAAVGVSRQHIQAIESEKNRPSMGLLRRIAEECGVSPDELLKTGAPKSAESFEDRKTHQQLQTILESGGERSKAVRVVIAAVHSEVLARTTSRHGPKPKAANH